MGIVVSFLGMAVLILVAVVLSKNRGAIRLRTVGLAFALQFLIGGLILYVPWGQQALLTASDAIGNVINYGREGMNFLFGNLLGSFNVGTFVDGKFVADPDGSIASTGFIFALNVLPLIIFFSSLIAVLYYLGIMQRFIRMLGGALQKLLGTSRAESMSAAANIFVGQTEAPLVVKPFIKNMTQSELFAVMCGGLASVAGSVLAGYAGMGVPLPYLIAASFMAAPGGLLFAKLLIPETETPESNEHMVKTFAADDEDAPANVIDAAANGATTGMYIAMNVGAMLLAFIGLIALINGMIGGVGNWFGVEGLSLDQLFGWIFAPVAWIIGTPWADAQVAGTFLGQKLAINEFFAYAQLQPYLSGELAGTLSAKTTAILSFALCGFANLSSIAILVGGLSIMAPSRRSDVARLGVYALIAGTLSNLMSATIAGLFIGLGGAAALGVG
ncbi:NupC/NupG family nucleoside CNT transporter [Suttonella sp. R2A3]|uniref:NupC/NupG family nucleoside CNT transporter n=1 Tax=Suttonella sp. R2A3 TaxID=2908648 RepID=UPI001F293FD2|nr:NupC/NupG family nucleoside CNT transporter [Suttonella sp. R2A3]UJF24401.1 NupC/NupG family nucleoside CNT transporter [Suttonella sp. R2A3]